MDILVTYVSINSRGQQQREQKRAAGPAIDVGRGTQCAIHLPDPRVDFTHARITVTDGDATIAATTGSLQINGRVMDGAKLAVGDKIEVGPYLLQIEEPPAGMPLALSVTLAVPLHVASGDQILQAYVAAPRLSKRRLSYLALFGVLFLCLLIPIAPDFLGYSANSKVMAKSMEEHVVNSVADKFLQTWNPGPVMQSHQPIGSDCRACHQFPFIQVRDLSCMNCHKSIKEHVPVAELTGVKGEAFRDTRCADCHSDHKGPQVLPRAQEQCATCHADVKQVAAKANSGKAVDFATEHPEFRLSLIDANTPDVIRRVRQGKPTAPDMVERSNLKFNHKLHLDPAGVRDPEGKRNASGVMDAQGKRTVMDCVDCHKPVDGGRLIAPVSMEKHCERCHSRAFEPKNTKRQVAHGDEAEVATMLREFYARQVLGDAPPGANQAQDLQRVRPGSVELSYPERLQALKIADQKADAAMRELFDTRGVCGTCHEVARKADGGWKVAPVLVAQVWMPQARFTHAKHTTQKCSTCHDAAKSSNANQVIMPDIAVCRDCHVGAKPVTGKVTSDCATCHKFHDGSDIWHGATQAQTLPKGQTLPTVQIVHKATK